MKSLVDLVRWVIHMVTSGSLRSSRTHFSSRMKYFVTDLGYLVGPSQEEAQKACKAHYGRPPKYVVEMSPHDLGPTPPQGQPLTVFELARRLEDLGVVDTPDKAFLLRYPKFFYDPASVL